MAQNFTASARSLGKVLINAVTAEVDLGEGNFTGFPTYQDLGFTSFPFQT
jgi:hypothetical protein